MRRTQAFLPALLAVVAALDIASALQMPHISGSARPPTPAIVATWVFAAVTLAAAAGLRRGARWPRPTMYVISALRVISGLLGIGDHAGTAIVVQGVIGVVLSLIVIALLVRTRDQVLTPAGELA